MLFKVIARSAGFGGVTVVTESPAEALTKARAFEEDPSLAVTIVDPVGNEYDAAAFDRLQAASSLTGDHVALIQSTCDVLLAGNNKAAEILYDTLFALAPEVRPMFAADMTEQKDKLTPTLVAAVGYLSDPDMFERIGSKLGQRHETYGVQREHYGPAGAALLATLDEMLGARFTPEVRAAWTALYVRISDLMIRGQQTRSAEAGSAA